MKINFTGTTYVRALKWLAIVIPALAALYEGVASALGLPFGNIIVEVAGYMTVFIMVLVGLAPSEESTDIDTE